MVSVVARNFVYSQSKINLRQNISYGWYCHFSIQHRIFSVLIATIHYFLGAFHAVEFEPTATANDVIEIIKSRIGLRSTSQGFALYEVLGDVERSMVSDEKLTDVMGKWERYR